MSKREKLLARIKNNPRDVSFGDLCKLLVKPEYVKMALEAMGV